MPTHGQYCILGDPCPANFDSWLNLKCSPSAITTHLVVHLSLVVDWLMLKKMWLAIITCRRDRGEFAQGLVRKVPIILTVSVFSFSAASWQRTGSVPLTSCSKGFFKTKYEKVTTLIHFEGSKYFFAIALNLILLNVCHWAWQFQLLWL